MNSSVQPPDSAAPGEAGTAPTRPDPTRPVVRPLGLPPGSVRALVALAVVGIIAHETLAGREVSLLLSETLLIILAHYFASRRLQGTAAPTEEHTEANPLWLPRSSVRWLIIAVFVTTGTYLVAAGRWSETAAIANLWLVFVYLIANMIGAWRRKRASASGPVTHLWQHLMALFMLSAATFLVLSSFTGKLQTLPDSLEKLLLAALLFYFGSR